MFNADLRVRAIWCCNNVDGTMSHVTGKYRISLKSSY